MTSNSFALRDARLVLRDRVIEHGWIVVEGGRIAEIGDGDGPRGATSIDGDTVIPGLVELHTDHLETHIEPRPKVRWDALPAVLAYDVQIAGAGIMTVFDCLRVGTDGDNPNPDLKPLFAVADALRRGGDMGILRAEHHAHLRCEVCSPNVLNSAQAMIDRFPIGILSIMDHTPGQRQFRDKTKLEYYYRGKLGMGEEELRKFFAERINLHERYAVPHRQALIALTRSNGITLASHDDTTVAHVEESLAAGARIAEFPTTIEAAHASHAAGVSVMMGAPNIMLGGSHSGNVAAEELARAGVLDILSSDYVPTSLLQAALSLPQRVPDMTLADAIATVTAKPAQAVGLTDRGSLTEGLRADVLRLSLVEDIAVVREVYREGRRVI
ncbi:MAG: alpha-D-ribose 1-methylphosphonate 5-triphosphate diphosphatase [Pseudomonadota bacterium]